MMSNAFDPGPDDLAGGSLALPWWRNCAISWVFDGLIMTDALGAGAISARHLTIAQASVDWPWRRASTRCSRATLASSALALQTASLTTAAIVAAVERGTLTRALLVAAAAQVLAATNTLRCASSVDQR